MKCLLSHQHDKLDDLIRQLEQLHSKLENEIIEYNDVVNDKRNHLANTADKYNDAVEEVRNFTQEIQKAMQAYYDAQPEAWQNSDDGEAYAKWIDAWNNAEVVIEDYDGPTNTDADEIDDSDCADNVDLVKELETEIDIP